MRIWRAIPCSLNSMWLMEGRRLTIAMAMGNSRTSGLNQSRCGRLKLPTSPSHPSTLPPLEKYVHIFPCTRTHKWLLFTIHTMCTCAFSMKPLTCPLHNMGHICHDTLICNFEIQKLFLMCILCRWMQRRGFPFDFPALFGFVKTRGPRMLRQALK